MKKLLLLAGLAALVTSCHAKTHEPPTQVVYRLDDHRFFELTGFNCEGALWYTDTVRNIHAEVVPQFYRIFTKPYRVATERYLGVTFYDASGVMVSKDYGNTWRDARFAPRGGAKRNGSPNPDPDDILSFTVVNDQGFIETRQGDLYMSSKPFDDPRLQEGGAGITYSFHDIHGALQHGRLMPGTSGLNWGEEYLSWNSVNAPEPWIIFAYKPNWQNIPNKVPEVKNYKGWDRMQCNPDLGLSVN